MKTTIFYFGLTSLILCLLSGCKPNVVLIKKSEHFKSLSTSIKAGKIVYINPEATVYFIRESVTLDFLSEIKMQNDLNSLMTEAAKKNKVSIEIVSDPQSDLYKKTIILLQKLKTDITLANTLQDNLIDRKTDNSNQKVFVYTPKISPEHAELSKITGTPFFGFCGIFSVSAHPESKEASQFMRDNRKAILRGNNFYIYHMIVNVESGEMIYRELRKVPTISNPAILHTTLYDSFFTLKQNLN